MTVYESIVDNVVRNACGEHYNQHIRVRTIKQVNINGERMRTKDKIMKTTVASRKTQAFRTRMLLFSRPVL